MTDRNLKIIVDQDGSAAEGLDGLIGLLDSGIGGAATAAIGALGLVTGAVLGIGAAAVSSWSQMDEGVDNFTSKTGVTGEALDAVQESIKNISESSAGAGEDIGNIGDVMGEVSQRTGATGKVLEKFTGKMLKLGKVTRGDPVKSTELITRVMGDWGIALEDSDELLDTLLFTSQKTGAGVDDLASKVVQFGAPLRQMGFSFNESVALLGKWEKEGVNTELVMGSLRIAAGHFADANIPLRDGLNQTMEAIKGAASESDGLAIAMDVFGARAGPDMAAAIREGRFSVEDLVATLGESEGALDRSADATLDFTDRFGIQMQRAQNALVPLGQVIMDFGDQYIMPGLTAAVDMFTGWADRVSAAYEANGLQGVWLMISGDLIILRGQIEAQIITWKDAFLEWVDDLVAAFPGRFNALKFRIIGEIVLAWPAIQTALAEWGTKFWNWTNDALIGTGAALEKLTASVSTWIEDHQADINESGQVVGRYVYEGIAFIFSDSETSDGAIQALVKSLATSAANAGASVVSLGVNFGSGMIQGIIQSWTGNKPSDAMAAAIKSAIFRAIASLNPFSYFTPVGRSAIDGIIKGLKNGWDALESAARQAAQKAYDAAMAWLGADSPSKLFSDKVGEEAIGGGIAQGIGRAAGAIQSSTSAALSPAAMVGGGILAGAGGGIGGGAAVVVQYSPIVSTASQIEVESKLVPLIIDGLRKRGVKLG